VTVPDSTRHLLTVWNPAYADNALDAHLRVLLRWAERQRAGAADEDDVYVWWAKDRDVVVDGRRIDLGARVPHQSLGTILHLLEHDDAVGRALGTAFSHADAGTLRGIAPREIRGLLELRNPAAHSEAVSRERVERLRALVMGVGCEGILVRLARAKGG
jgi:hypothetical protein